MPHGAFLPDFTNISHELRTPLTLILSPVDSMLKECSTEKDLRRLSTIKTNATRLLYLVNQLLDFRKNEIAGLNLHLSSGDMVSTLRQICQQFGDVSERRNMRAGRRLFLPTTLPTMAI